MPEQDDVTTPLAWVVIEREHGTDVYVGPYPTEDDATLAMDDAPLIDTLIPDDCIECFVTTVEPDDDHHQIGVDLSNPDHTG